MAVETGDHVVQFYERDSDLVSSVGAYLITAVRAGEVAVVIATEAHRRAFEAELEMAGIDAAEAHDTRSLIALDAASTLSGFMPSGQIDDDAFREVIGGVIREAVGTGRRVRAYGEMVALLWDAGDVIAAIQLESLWNDLGRELPFSLFCAYPASSVSGSEHTEAVQQVCDLHSSVFQPSFGGPDRRGPLTARHEASRQFAADVDAPRAARRFLVDALRGWRLGEALVDDAALVVTELATNAVVHARSPFTVAVRADESVVRISVRDASRVAPTVGPDRLMARSGRGLLMVAALASDWGVVVATDGQFVNDGKVVWAELGPIRAS